MSGTSRPRLGDRVDGGALNAAPAPAGKGSVTGDLDEDGYPSEMALEAIRTWSMASGYSALLTYAQSIWHWQQYVKRDGRNWRFITGGWSGNEDVIRAMQDNGGFWSVCWISAQAGGDFAFEVPEAMSEMAALGAA